MLDWAVTLEDAGGGVAILVHVLAACWASQAMSACRLALSRAEVARRWAPMMELQEVTRSLDAFTAEAPSDKKIT